VRTDCKRDIWISEKKMVPPSDSQEQPLSPDKIALFQQFLGWLNGAGQVAAAGAGHVADAAVGAAGTAAEGVRGAAVAIGDVAGGVGEKTAENAKDAANFVQKHPGVLAVGAIGPVAPIALAAIAVLTAKKIVESRKNPEINSAQIMFRVPEALRDDVRRLSLDEKRSMEELLTEAVVLLLAQYGRNPSILMIRDDRRE
jgi:hypothetical protein